eukprot:COSAG01_NODE_1993_length_8694_cov_3.220826_3_plen_300_part_00
MLTAIARHRSSALICLHAMSFFKHVADSDAGASALLDQNEAIPQLLNALANHPEDMAVQERGLICLLNLVFDGPGLEHVTAHAREVVKWVLPIIVELDHSTSLHVAVQLLQRLAESPHGRLAILLHAHTSRLLARAKASPAPIDASDDSDEETQRTVSAVNLRDLSSSLVAAGLDEPLRAMLNSRQHSQQAATLALNCAGLVLPAELVSELFVGRQQQQPPGGGGGGLHHLCGPFGLLSPAPVTRLAACAAVRGLLQLGASIETPADALPPQRPVAPGIHDFSRFVNNPLTADAVFVVQ